MKCPKCGYTSFDYLDACKKCGGDLRETRSFLQIIAVSPDQRGAMAAPVVSAPEGPSPGSDYRDDSPSADFSEFSGPTTVEPNVEVLGDLNFDESFDDMMEPTSYRDASPSPPKKPAPADEDEGLLDIDFGDVFGDKDSAKS